MRAESSNPWPGAIWARSVEGKGARGVALSRPSSLPAQPHSYREHHPAGRLICDVDQEDLFGKVISGGSIQSNCCCLAGAGAPEAASAWQIAFHSPRFNTAATTPTSPVTVPVRTLPGTAANPACAAQHAIWPAGSSFRSGKARRRHFPLPRRARYQPHKLDF